MHHARIPSPLISIAIALMLVPAVTLAAETIQLRAKANVTDTTVRLKDVAVLTGEGVESLGETVVARFEASQSMVTLSQDALRGSLAKVGVNWARTSLKGFEKCQISRENAEADGASRKPENIIEAPVSPILSNPVDEVAADGQNTIRQRLTEWLRIGHADKDVSLRVTYADRDAKLLDGIVLHDKLVFTTSASSNLGRVPVTIQRYRGDKLVDSSRLTVDVAMRQLAVVAVKAVGKGASLTADDVEVREVFLERVEPHLLPKLDDAIGLIAATNLREGSLVLTDQVRPPVLIQRNDRIRIQVLVGGLNVQFFGRAMEDGGEGQTIEARNERTRETVMVRVVSNGQALMVSGDEEDLKPETPKSQAENQSIRPDSKGKQ